MEGDPSRQLKSNLASKSKTVDAVYEYVFPHNITLFLEMRGLPHTSEIDVIKIDVDGYEYFLMESILNAGYRPKLLHVEPIMFLPPFVDIVGHAQPVGNNFGNVMLSIGALARLARNHGYLPLLVDMDHVMFIREDLDKAFVGSDWLRSTDLDAHWLLGHACNPMTRFAHCADFWLATLGIDSGALSDPSVPIHERRNLVSTFWRNQLGTRRNCYYVCPQAGIEGAFMQSYQKGNGTRQGPKVRLERKPDF